MPNKKKSIPKAQSGYVSPWQDWMSMYQPQPMQNTLPETQVIAQGNIQQRYYGIQEPQPLPVNYQKPQGQPIQNRPAPSNYTQAEGQQQPMMSGMGGSNAAGSIAQGAYILGDVLDTIGDIRRGIITAGSSILNSLIPDNNNKRQRAIQFVNSQDPYGSQQYNNMFENGGQLSASKAKKILKDGQVYNKKLSEKQRRYFGWIAGGGKAAQGATVTDWGYNTPTNLTPAQEAVLNGTVPYTTPIERIPQPSSYGYYTPNQDGSFMVNIDRHLMDRNAASGRIGDTYSYGTNRSYGFEGTYGNRNYQPIAYMNTGFNRYFENGGNIPVNNSGYLDGSPTAQNPVNIIPGQNGMTNITMNGVSQPIIANGQVLYPQSGNYLFPTETVVEQQLYKQNETYELSEEEVKNLKSLGYDLEFI